jgi:uncharacterized protein YndB with AHSA1/START domain
MTTEEKFTVQVTHRYKSSAERVFDAWLNPEITIKWMFATETGTMVRADVDARVGGRFNFTDRRDGEDVEHIGEYLEIDRPRRLVFTFGVPKYSNEMSRVTVEIEPLPDGSELKLTNEGIPQEYRADTQRGWTTLLGRLETIVD